MPGGHSGPLEAPARAQSVRPGGKPEVGAAAAALHHHGVLAPPNGAEVLLAAPDGAAVAYLDRTSTAGTILVSTIDPLAHFGHTGAPNAARFLDELLLWVTTALPRRRDGS
jgi:hypothetical protein